MDRLAEGEQIDAREREKILEEVLDAFAILPNFSRALCAQVDPEIFFPYRSAKGNLRAKRICMKCPEIVGCRDFAIKYNIRYGVWGGLSEKDRLMFRGLLNEEVEDAEKEERAS